MVASKVVYCSLVLCSLLIVPSAARREPVLSAPQKLRCYADIAFALDGSGSVGRENWLKTLEFVYRFAGSLPFDLNRFGVVSFGNAAYVDIKLDDFYDYESFRRKVETIRYLDENTNTADGIRKMRSLFGGYADRPEVPNIGLIITDGVATVERESMFTEADEARRQGINLFGIGIGSQYDRFELESLIRDPARIYSADDFDDLLLNLEKIVGLACTEPPTTPRPLPPILPCANKNLAFVVDASGSVTKENFEEAKIFLKNFVNELPFEYDYRKLALLCYSTETFIKRNFGQLSSKDEVLRQIDSMEHINQRTNLSGAIKVVREEIFTANFKEEYGYNDNVVVVLTDQKSNTDVEKLPLEAELAQKENLKVFAIGLEDTADLYEMSLLASEPKKQFMHFVNTYKNLATLPLSRLIKDTICTHQYPSYRLDIRSDECYSDVVFVVESQNREDFEKQKQIIKDVATKLGSCLYGVVMLGERPFSAVPFNSYESVTGFANNVDRLPYQISNMNLLGGLDVVERMFTSRSSSINLGVQRHPERRQGFDTSVKFSKSYDLSQLVVLITSANSYVDMNRLQLKMDSMTKVFPRMGLFSIGYGNQVNVEMLKMVSSKPHGLFIMKEQGLSFVQDKIDKVVEAISSVTAVPYYTCDFEKLQDSVKVPDTCDFVQEADDSIPWLINSGETLSLRTGPMKAWNGTFYAYLEATGRVKGEKAVLSKRSYKGGRLECCMLFHYNMNGHHSGKLEVFSVDPFGKETVVWMQHGDKGSDWKLGVASIAVPDGGRIGFRAIRGAGFSSDIGLDAVSTHYGGCPIAKQFPADSYGYKWW